MTDLESDGKEESKPLPKETESIAAVDLFAIGDNGKIEPKQQSHSILEEFRAKQAKKD